MKLEKSLTAREWLLQHRSKYTTENGVFRRAQCINDCSSIIGITQRTVRRRMKTIEDEERKEFNHDDFLHECDFMGKEPVITIDEERGFAGMTLISQVPKTPEAMIKLIGLDMTIWEMTKHIVNFWGNADNPNYQTKVWFQRVVSNTTEKYLDDIMEKMKNYTPNYPKIMYSKLPEENMLELSIADAHIGQQAWGKECGTDYDLKIALNRFETAGDRILLAAQQFPIAKILIPLGNDFFNVNDITETTAAGTPQNEDSRYFKVYSDAFDSVIRMIDKCRTIAPVEVIVIPGNHDKERVQFLAHSLWSWYRNCDEVNINISHTPYTFFTYGNTLLGFTHGNNIKMDRLPLLMATEMPIPWGKSKFREFHIGHFHHRNSTVFLPMQEMNGVMVKTLPSLCSRDSWHKMHGFSSLKGAVGFIWSKSEGCIAEYGFHV